MIQFSCSTCQKTLSVPEQHAGKIAKCPKCQTQMVIPGPSSIEELVDEPISTGPPMLEATEPSQRSVGTPWSNSTLPTSVPVESNSFGRSLVGLVAASGIGIIATIVWIAITIGTGREFGLLAWAIGGIVGVVAGAIAKNRSVVFCSMVAGIAALSILSAKLIIGIGLFFISQGLSFAQNLDAVALEDEKYAAAIKDEMLTSGGFTEEERPLVMQQVLGFFHGNIEIEESLANIIDPDLEDVDDPVIDRPGRDEQPNWTDSWRLMASINAKVASRLQSMSLLQKQEFLQRAMAKYPDWFEWHHEYAAIVHDLSASGVLTEEGLRTYAQKELELFSGKYDEQYYEKTSEELITRFGDELRKLAAEKRKSLDAIAMDGLVLESLKQHPNWVGHPDEHLSVMEMIQRENGFPVDLQSYVRDSLGVELGTLEGDSMQDSMDAETIDKMDERIAEIVNGRLVEMDIEQRQKLVADLSRRNPSWKDPFGMDDPEFKKAAEEVGLNLTVGEALGQVFQWTDALWVFLGISTAYGAAYRRGSVLFT